MSYTPRLDLKTGSLAGDQVAPADWDILNDSVENLAGREGTDLHGVGLVSGWKFDTANPTTPQVLAGRGYLGDGLRAATLAVQAITGVQPSLTQIVWAVPTANTGRNGQVVFQVSASRPSGAAKLFTITTDGSSHVTAVNGAAFGTYDYCVDADILPICKPAKITDSVEITAAPVGHEYRFTVDHAVLGRFAFAEAPALTYLPGIRVTLAPDYAANGTGFAFFFEVLSAGEAVILEDNSVSTVYAWGRGAPPATVDVTFSWTRRGFLLPGIVAPS
jgi:hypothetical protein